MKNLRDYKKNGQQFAYLLDAIDGVEYGINLKTDKEKINFLFDTFYKEYYNCYLRKNKGEFWILTEWLAGLPSAINLPFCNDDIIKVGKNWGYCQTDKKADKFVENWFAECANKLLQIKRILNK